MFSSTYSHCKQLVLRLIFLICISGIAWGQTTSFTYQGKLTDAGNPPTAPYDLIFRLFDASGTQIGTDQPKDDVQVTTGIFTVTLDFGESPFTGTTADTLEIAVRPGASTGAYTTLTPRQPLTSSPYAIKSKNAASADTATNSTQLNGLPASEYVITTDPRMTDPRTPTAGSSNYIQNQNTGAQTPSNFNISGNGTAGGTLKGDVVTAVTQYNLGGSRVLSTAGTNNVFVGPGTGSNNSGGTGNSFLGQDAGNANTSGSFNTFVGRWAGFTNTTGESSTFVGFSAGKSNTTGIANSFFGSQAGNANTTANYNSFFGYQAGRSNTTGNFNSFFGDQAGNANTTGALNSFFGSQAGNANTTGNYNSFFGYKAGIANTTGYFNSFFGFMAGTANTTGFENSFFGIGSGGRTTTGSHNTFVGTQAGGEGNETGSDNTLLGASADVTADNLNYATAIGAGASVGSSNTIVLGRAIARDTVDIPGKLEIDTLAAAGSTALCLNASNRVGTCSSSLRYKTDLAPYGKGFDIVRRLRPISFTWKDGGKTDLGFGAEDVEKIDPLLVTYNKDGQVEGVKYDRLSVAFVIAFKEQQAQIEQQKEIVKNQQRQIDELKRLACLTNPQAEICKEDPK